MEFAVHQLAGYRLLARRCPGDHDDTDLLWQRVSADAEDGTLASSEPGIGAVGATLQLPDGPVYCAGVPSEPETSVDGYEAVEVPGGAYAMVTYHGDPEHLAQVLEALREAVADAGEELAGEAIEVYRGPDEEGRNTVDIGLRLAAP